MRQRGLIRQWKMVRALQASRMGMTFSQLRVVADDDPVSLRTIRRDVDTLTFAGMPIEVESGNPHEPKPAKVFWREETVN